eukprot:15447150-Alexandrium_andersonii.AAC.1
MDEEVMETPFSSTPFPLLARQGSLAPPSASQSLHACVVFHSPRGPALWRARPESPTSAVSVGAKPQRKS